MDAGVFYTVELSGKNYFIARVVVSICLFVTNVLYAVVNASLL